jgi:Sulfotransferase family
MALPDFLIIGAPKAGSTALHAALARHPQLFLSTPKEPKYFMTGDRPPSRASHRGPGDAHSRQEWVWQRERYEGLFESAPAGTLRGESTPFYLWDRAAHRRIRAAVPEVRMIAVLRDPVERAYSNWTHLWSNGLEREPDFLRALQLEPSRVARGYAPFWRYAELGRYGEQLEHLFTLFPPEQVHVLRYRELVNDPASTLDAISTFLGIDTGVVGAVPPSNVVPWAPDTGVNAVIRTGVRAGAMAGAYAPPHLWRRAEERLLRLLHRGAKRRAPLSPEARASIVPRFAADIAVLERVTGRSFQDWLGDSGTDTYSVRSS